MTFRHRPTVGRAGFCQATKFAHKHGSGTRKPKVGGSGVPYRNNTAGELLIEVELVLKARQGDNTAWAELVGLHQQAVFRLAYLHLADPAEAEDAAQECFIHAYRSLERFDTSRPLRPWLLRIVSNLAINRKRSIGRYWAAVQRTARQQPMTQAGPEAADEAKADEQLLWKAIKTLPAKMQAVLYLRFFLELPVEEVAQALNEAEGTVKSQTHRALEKLREKILENAHP